MTDEQSEPLDPSDITPERLSHLARYVFGEEVQWSKLDMLEYDNDSGKRSNFEEIILERLKKLPGIGD